VLTLAMAILKKAKILFPLTEVLILSTSSGN
jgi:hypothetical protein